jgi:hypothetical protein
MIYSTSTGSALFQVTTYGRGLLNAADASGLRTALDLGDLSGLDSITNSNIVSNAAVSLSKLQTIPPSTLVGNTGTSSATPSTIALNSFTLNSWSLPTASLNLNNQRIISVATPVEPQDAVTKGWAESLVATAQVNTATGDATADLVYPIGSNLLITTGEGSGTTVALNAAVTVYYNTTTNVLSTSVGSGFTQLTGTWRCRGSNTVQVGLPNGGLGTLYIKSVLVQRVA